MTCGNEAGDGVGVMPAVWPDEADEVTETDVEDRGVVKIE